MAGDTGDSGLSIAANIIALLTFAVALSGAVLLRVDQLRGWNDQLRKLTELQIWFLTECKAAQESYREAVHREIPRREEILEREMLMDEMVKLRRKIEEAGGMSYRIPRHSGMVIGKRNKLSLQLRQSMNMQWVRECVLEGEVLRSKVMAATLSQLRRQANESEKWRKEQGELMEKLCVAVQEIRSMNRHPEDEREGSGEAETTAAVLRRDRGEVTDEISAARRPESDPLMKWLSRPSVAAKPGIRRNSL